MMSEQGPATRDLAGTSSAPPGQFGPPVADGSARMLATPVDFGGHRPTAVRAAPEPGQHTEEVLLELGYDWDAIVDLKAGGVIP